MSTFANTSFGRLLLVACGIFLATAARSQQLSPDPVFALNTQSHTGSTLRLAVTPDERAFVTAGFDKTVRVWDVETGEQLRRFFLPVRDAIDGAIESLSLSPDGERLALGGGIFGFGKGRSVVVMSMRDGQIVQSLSGFRLTPRTVSWSRDGRFLAVGMNGNDGPSAIHVFETATWKRVFLDRELRGRVDTIEFRRDGTFFATTNNPTIANEVFLYKPAGDGFARAASKSLGRRILWRGAWSADERHFYVGGHSYFKGDDLSEPAWPEARKRPPAAEGFNQLRESPDGQQVVASSYRDHDTAGRMRRYADRRLGSFDEAGIPDPRVAHFAVLRNGQIVYVAQDGAVAGLGADLKLRWRNAASYASFRGRPERLKVSADGRWITLRAGGGTDAPELAFDLHEARYERAKLLDLRWNEPVTSRRDMQLLAWSGTSSGTLNGHELPRRHVRELAVSAAIHPTEPAMVYGTTFSRVRKVDAEGKEIWSRFLAAEVSALNLIPAANLVVAATEDGYLRLLRWEDGATVLTYYLQPAERKWLAVAETGHYAAGIGAEDLAGWIVNRGTSRMADFFPLSRFRERYLLPDFMAPSIAARDSRVGVGKAMERRDGAARAEAERKERDRVQEARRLAEAERRKGETVDSREPPDAADPAADPLAGAQAIGQPMAPSVDRLPPAIDILSPGYETATGARQLKIRYRAQTAADAPLTSLRAQVMSASQATRGLVPKNLVSDGAELTVDLPAEDSEVQITATNRWGSAEPVRIKVRWTGDKQGLVARGVLRVVSIGVSEYDRPEYRLGFAAKDAADFANQARQQAGRLFSTVRHQVLTDRLADRAGIEKAIEGLREQVAPQDMTMIFLAGHGVNDAGGDYLYLPRDAHLERLRETGLSFRRLGDLLASLPGRTVMFVDTCHSGGIIRQLRAGQDQNHAAAVNELASSEKNIIVFASSTGGQLSLEDPAWGNGAFTKALVEGLAGKADLLKRGRVTYKQLDAYVSDRVDELTRGRQTPVTPVLQGVPDFALAEVGK